MRRLLGALLIVAGLSCVSRADSPVYFSLGPLQLNVPLKTANVVYLYDFLAKSENNLVGGETPFITLWNIVHGNVGVVTSLTGQGTPFLSGDIYTGNVLDKYLSLGPVTIGGGGGYNFQTDSAIAFVKASTKIW